MSESFKTILECRCCGNPVDELLDLNEQPLANLYHKEEEYLEEYPLKLNLCHKCFHMQLSVAVNPELMFKNYLYVSGTTNTLHEYFNFFAHETVQRYEKLFNKKPKSVLDIACNDGTQLDYYKKLGVETFGIDPAENLYERSSKNHNIICDFFPSNKISGKYSLIIAQNVFAHTHDITSFLNQCYDLLDEEGLLFIQTSQAAMIGNNEFDTIYHEHVSFFSTKSMKTILEKCKFFLNNVSVYKIHGLSYVFEASKTKHNDKDLLNNTFEKEMGLYNLSTYEKFAENAEKIAYDFKSTIDTHRNKGFKIIGYGAAAKGNTLLNFSKATLDYILDDNPLKQGLYTPGSNILIKSTSSLLEEKSDKILFIPLAWNFYDEIYGKIKRLRDSSNDLFLKYFPCIDVLT